LKIQGRVATHLTWCDGIFDNHVIANFRAVCQWKDF